MRPPLDGRHPLGVVDADHVATSFARVHEADLVRVATSEVAAVGQIGHRSVVVGHDATAGAGHQAQQRVQRQRTLVPFAS